MNVCLQAYTLSECMENMAALVVKSENEGRKNIIFCEDRLTLIAERALLAATGGTFLSSVYTFARFLHRDAKNTVSKQGSVMAVANIMARLENEKRLRIFNVQSSSRNNAKCIYETLAQFAASEITVETLQESAQLLPEGALKQKVLDLTDIYKEYAAFLEKEHYLDESKYLSLLPSALAETEDISKTNVFFVCYSSFTAQALKTVRSAAEHARNVFGIFCDGEEDIYTHSARNSFLRECAKCGEVKQIQAGVPLEGEAEFLRRGLYNPERHGKQMQPTDKVRIFEADDKNAETEYVAVQILRAMQADNTLRYRDFALLAPDVKAYAQSIKHTFAQYEIPLFIDEKKSLGAHPLAQFLLACLQVVKDGFSPDSVQALTQNYFFGESDEYRNYLLKFANFRNGAKRDIKENEMVEKNFSVPRLKEARNRLLKAVEGIPKEGKGRAFCLAIRQILVNFDAEEKLETLENRLQDVSLKSYLAQIYDALEGVLAEAELLTGDSVLKVGDFAAVLKDGLDATEISLIPLKADAVFVGDIADSRIEKVAYLFAVGLTEDVPRSGVDASVITDREIESLAQVKAYLEPTVAEVNLRTRESVCLNLCTFLKELHLTYPLTADGSEPALSDIFRYVRMIFADLNGNELAKQKHMADEWLPYQCAKAGLAVRQMLLKKNEYERKFKGEKLQAEYSSIYDALQKMECEQGGDYWLDYKAQDSVSRGEQLFLYEGKISPTKLETYFTCPFKNFAQNGLRLKEREEAAVLSLDTGNFIHTVLERTAGQIKEGNIKEDKQAYDYAQTVGKELLSSPLYAAQQDEASHSVFSRNLLDEAASAAVAVYRQIAHSSYQIEKLENKIEGDIFSGKVDRVDVAPTQSEDGQNRQYIRVIDYKSGGIETSASSYYVGKKLQLELYMSALAKEAVPAGVFYFPTSIQYDTKQEGKFQLKGFFNNDTLALRSGDNDICEEHVSEFFPASLKKSSAQSGMDEQSFRDFIEYSTLVSKQGYTELKEGYVAPTPYEGACNTCKYGGMCGFNRETEKSRKERTASSSEVVEIVRKNREKEETQND